MSGLFYRLTAPSRTIDCRESDIVKTQSPNQPGRAWPLVAAAALAALLQAGCACSGSLGFRRDCCEECYPVWPCYGVHSTCWRPWPTECPPCPSPFPPETHSPETLPAAGQPSAPPALDDQPLEPPAGEIDPIPATPPAFGEPPQPLTPPLPPEISPSSFMAPVVEAPDIAAPPDSARTGSDNSISGELETESSSRRRKESAGTPLGSPAPTFQSTRNMGTLRWAPASSR